jgi:antitoxin YefM
MIGLVRKYSFLYVTEGAGMRTVNFTQLLQNLAAELDSVTDDAEEPVVTRSGHEPVVIVPLAEYESMKETEYLLRSPVNAEALRRRNRCLPIPLRQPVSTPALPWIRPVAAEASHRPPVAAPTQSTVKVEVVLHPAVPLPRVTATSD